MAPELCVPVQQEGEAPAAPQKRKKITELQRISAMIQGISTLTALVPKGSQLLDAKNTVKPNKLFAGLQYPDKLESYLHAKVCPPCSLNITSTSILAAVSVSAGCHSSNPAIVCNKCVHCVSLCECPHDECKSLQG